MGGMQVNPFQRQATQGLQQSAQKLNRAGDKNNDNKLDFSELQKLQQQSKEDPGKFKKDFGLNAKQLEQLQKLGDQKNFNKAAGGDGQLDANEMARALGQQGDAAGQRFNFCA